MHRGFVKVYRKIMEWEWYTDVPVKVLFMHALIKANHSEKQWQGHIIKEGQFISSLGNMAKETGLSTAQVRTALKKLEKTKEIIKKGTNKNTIVTVCNYESYMSEEQSNDNQMTNKEQSNDNQMTTTKNNKNNKNNKNVNNKTKFVPDISALDSNKIELLNEWLDYKKSKKQGYKAQSGITKLINEFNKVSYEDIRDAVDKAIQSNYAGVFVKKSNEKSKGYQGAKYVQTNYDEEAF